MITVSTILADNRILVGADYCGRAANCLLSHAWTKCRVALRLCVANSGANVNPAHFYVGLSTGPALFQTPVVPPNPAHTAQFLLTGNFNTWNFLASGGGNPDRYSRKYCSGELYVNGVFTAGSAVNIEDGENFLGANDANRTLLFCDFTKGSPNWTMDYFRNTGAACVDVSQADFETQSLNAIPVFADHSYAGGSTMPVDEATNGYFTHVNLAWNNAAPVIKISDLRVITFP
jgi:hypothetical protein